MRIWLKLGAPTVLVPVLLVKIRKIWITCHHLIHHLPIILHLINPIFPHFRIQYRIVKLLTLYTRMRMATMYASVQSTHQIDALCHPPSTLAMQHIFTIVIISYSILLPDLIPPLG